MKHYAVIVIGSGSGMSIVDYALSRGLKTALVDKGPLGGTCLNTGCIPSKMLIYPADIAARISDSGRLGIKAGVESVDFKKVMNRMRRTVRQGRKRMEAGIEKAKNLDYYNAEARFTGDYALSVGGEVIKGDKVFIASGARPLIPPIKGIDEVNYLTNESLLELDERPESLIIVGGGYVGCEYAHFLASMGVKVTVIQRNEFLVPNEEPGVSELLKSVMFERMKVLTSTEASGISEYRDGFTVTCTDQATGKVFKLRAEQVLIAAGRRSNADLLGVDRTGVETDERGYIKVDEFFETAKDNIWSFGDAIGRQMFKHAANEEAEIVLSNAFTEHKHSFDFSKVPHAVFSYPQIASIGLGEEEAKKDYDVLIGRADYSSVAKGEAMMVEQGFAKAVVEKGSGRILGFHVIGPHAPILIQEVINVVYRDGTVNDLFKPMHIHPALPEVILSVFSNLEESQS